MALPSFERERATMATWRGDATKARWIGETTKVKATAVMARGRMSKAKATMARVMGAEAKATAAMAKGGTTKAKATRTGSPRAKATTGNPRAVKTAVVAAVAVAARELITSASVKSKVERWRMTMILRAAAIAETIAAAVGTAVVEAVPVAARRVKARASLGGARARATVERWRMKMKREQQIFWDKTTTCTKARVMSVEMSWMKMRKRARSMTSMMTATARETGATARAVKMVEAGTEGEARTEAMVAAVAEVAAETAVAVGVTAAVLGAVAVPRAAAVLVATVKKGCRGATMKRKAEVEAAIGTTDVTTTRMKVSRNNVHHLQT